MKSARTDGRGTARVRARLVTDAELIREFGWLGIVGFGGAAVTISIVREHLVVRKKWLTNPEFVEAVAVGQTLPGVIGSNIASFIGFRLNGLRGAALALSSFILPSFLLMIALGSLYRLSQNVLTIQRVFAGVNPAAAGLIAAAGLVFGKSTILNWRRLSLAVAACVIVVVFHGLAVEVIIGSALLGIFTPWFRTGASISAIDSASSGKSEQEIKSSGSEDIRGISTRALVIPALITVIPIRWLELFVLFVKIGAFTMGGGYVMLPIMENDVVRHFGWVTARQFADGVALGMITPGPVAITATFIGQMTAGWPGAVIATVAIFLPSFIFMVLAGAYLNRFRENRLIRHAIDGVTPTVAGLLIAGAITLGRTAITSPLSAITAAAVALMVALWKINPLPLLLGAGLLGFLLNR